MKKIFTKKFIISTLICLVSLLEGIICYNKLPETMATHFSFSGIPNGYSTKAFAVSFLPLLFTALNFLIAISFEYSPKVKNASHLYKEVYFWLCPVLSVVIQTSVILFAFNINITVISLVIVVLYVLTAIIASIKDRKEDK